MDVVDLRRVRVPTYYNHSLACSHKYKHDLASCLRLSIDAENMQVLLRVRTAAAWEQLRISQLAIDTALYLPRDEFGAIPEVFWLRLCSTLTIQPICTVLCFVR